MSLHYNTRRLPHSNPLYPQQVPSFPDYHSSTIAPLVSPPLPLFKPTLPMGTIHRHLKRKLSGISSEACQKEELCTRPVQQIKKARRWGPDGRAVQAGAAQPIAIPRPPIPKPVYFGGTRITAVTSAWRVRPDSKDDESSESDTDEEEETITIPITRYLATYYRGHRADVTPRLETRVQNSLQQHTKMRITSSIAYTGPERRAPVPCRCPPRLPMLEPRGHSQGAQVSNSHLFHLCQ